MGEKPTARIANAHYRTLTRVVIVASEKSRTTLFTHYFVQNSRTGRKAFNAVHKGCGRSMRKEI